MRRTTRAVELAPAGEAFLAEARRTVAQAEAAVQVARRARAAGAIQLRLGFSGYTSCPIFSAITHRLRQRLPEVRLDVRQATSDQLMEALDHDELDAAFLLSFQHAPAPSSATTVERLFADPLVVVLPTSHPLARASELTLGALANETILTVARAAAPRWDDLLLAACRRAGFTPGLPIRDTDNASARLDLVAAGVGVSLLASSTCPRARDGLACVPVDDPILESWTSIAWRQADDSPALRQFLESAREVVHS